MAHDAWLGLCEIPVELCDEYNLRPFDSIVIHNSSNSELTTTVVQVVPSKLHDVRLHPLVWEFLCRASTDTNGDGFQIHALPLEGSVDDILPLSNWMIRNTNVIDLDSTVTVHGTIIYSDGDATNREIQRALEGRILKSNAMIVVSTMVGFVVLLVHSISNSDPALSYRIGPVATVQLKRLNQTTERFDNMDSDWEIDCPGYDILLADIYLLCTTRGFAAPSGILLTGCSGVGKTRLVSCLANRITTVDGGYVHWVSCQDLVTRASWASESELLEFLLPSRPAALVVVDDIQVLSTDDRDSSDRDYEYILLRNSLVRALDRLRDVVVLGICHTASSMPSQLVRIDRLEKELKMDPPTQIQREAILESLIPNHPRWISALIGPTAGFVAADLHRMYIDAWTTAQARSQDIQWHDLRDAVHRTNPSQLALLDVARPRPLLDGNFDNPLELYKRSWQRFGGYAIVKKRIYRTVVAPWHRQIKMDGPSIFGISPPKGVLFHGLSGTGKTLAASCLALSLGLNVVKVRASDVLDQWLGGSEAAIRSLFHRARGAQPCILYFDEIDAIASNREQEGTESDVSSRILTTLLNEIDGISSSSNSGVLVLACTNRIQDLDAALLRPGRLEEHIELKLPTTEDIREILQLHLSNVPIADDVNLTLFAEIFFELESTGADVEGVCRDACSMAIRSFEVGNSIALNFEVLDKALRNFKRCNE